MPNTENSGDNSTAIENSLKDLLDKILTYFEKFIKTKDDLKALENKLSDYENIVSLVDIIKNVFSDLTAKIDEKMSTAGDENYTQLEKIVQKYEGEIRNHIRVEQQLKLYAESLQSKLEDSEKTRTDLLDQTKGMINVNSVKRDNQKLAENLKTMKDENDKLIQRLQSLEELNREYEEKLATIPILQEKIRALEKILSQQETKSTKSTLNSQYNTRDMQSLKKLNLEVDYNKSHLKTDSTGRSVTAAYQQHPSPLKGSNRGTPTIPHSSTKTTSDYLKVKIEITENSKQNKEMKELEALKNSYQKFYNPLKQSRERHSNSVSKTREIRSIYSNSNIVHNSSNNSLIQANQNKQDPNMLRLHKRSKSHCAPNKTRQSLTKQGFEGNAFAIAQDSHESKTFEKKLL
jgi:DNA repair ATPase RecN